MEELDTFVAPYDPVADEFLQARGWKSRRDEGWTEHWNDSWTWPASYLGPGTLPTQIQCEGQSFRVFYATPSILLPRAQVEYANRDELVDDLASIEDTFNWLLE